MVWALEVLAAPGVLQLVVLALLALQGVEDGDGARGGGFGDADRKTT